MVFARQFVFSAIGLFISLLCLTNAQGQDEELLRYQFKPALGTEIVQSVETATALITSDFEHEERWSHEVIILLEETNAAGNFTGTFMLRNVINVENAQDDIHYLIAKAIEGERYELEMHPFGFATDIDWVSVRARVEHRLPALTAPANVEAIRAAMTMFSDPAKAVLRSIDLAALTYVIPFRRDGELHETADLGALTYFALEEGEVQVGGGLDPDIGEYILDWLVTNDTELATAALAPQLRSLAAVMDGRTGSDSTTTIDAAIDQGFEVAEDGYAVYDLDLGLLREATIVALISSEPVAFGARTKVTRLSP